MLYKEGLGRCPKPRVDRRGNGKGKAFCTSISGTRGVDPQGTRSEQGTDKETRLYSTVRAGVGGLQSHGTGLAIADRSGPAADQQDQVNAKRGSAHTPGSTSSARKPP